MYPSSCNGRATAADTAAHVLAELQTRRIVAVLREPSVDLVIRRAHDLFSRGIELIELTTSTPGWPNAVSRVLHELPQAVIGVGTLTTPVEVERATDHGASFLVSPGCDQRLLQSMLDTGLLALPGCFTPSEIMSAARLGARIVKIFPACSVGTDGVRAMRGPFPGIAMVVSGGIHASNAIEWLEAGATAVAMGSAISSLSGEQLRQIGSLGRTDQLRDAANGGGARSA